MWRTPGRGSLAGDHQGREAAFGYFGRLGQETGGTFKDGRIIEGAEHFRDLYAWDEFWS